MTLAAAQGREGGHSIEQTVRAFSGAKAVRVTEFGGRTGSEHAHDWPILSLFVAGGHVKLCETGATRIAAPSAVFHPAGAFHANAVGPAGMEQIDIVHDPRWLPGDDAAGAQVSCWIGGPVAAAAGRLAARWRDPLSGEAELAGATAAFLALARRAPGARRPPWLDEVVAQLHRGDVPADTRRLARRIGLSPAWLAQAYRAAMGEGLGETVRRARVEQACVMLRASDDGAAGIAAAAGFCDQSHMIRSFGKVLGRTPAQVRAEAKTW